MADGDLLLLAACVVGRPKFTRDFSERNKMGFSAGMVVLLPLHPSLMFPLKAVSVIPTLSVAAGGPTFSVAALCEATAVAGVEHSLVTVHAAAGQLEHFPNPDLVQTLRVNGLHFPKLRLSWSPLFRSKLRAFCRERGIQTIQSHGLWTQANHIAASLARELNLPLVVSTHGMLEPWAWGHHAWKKRPVWWLWEHRNLRSAAVLRATAPQEVSAIRRLGLGNPVALIPNGVLLPSGLSRSEPRGASGRRLAVFLGRIHPVKGLQNLIEAWHLVRPEGWHCKLAGPDEGGHRSELQALVRKYDLEHVFEFSGMLAVKEKWEFLRAANLLVQPSFTENFGIAVAEALASGVPVITTKGTPWGELVSRQCGWWVDVGVAPLAAALREATSLSSETRQAMGQRGRHLVEEKYAWPQIGRNMLAVYAWVLGKGPQPACVQLA